MPDHVYFAVVPVALFFSVNCRLSLVALFLFFNTALVNVNSINTV